MSAQPARLALASFTLAVVLASLPIASAAAAPWMPLLEGALWEYRTLGGLQQTETITGTVSLFGRTLYVRRVLDGADVGLLNFWQVTPEGSVLLGGFDNASAGLALAYDPPIMMLAAPPTLGATWSTHSVAYELPSLAEYATLDLDWEVLEELDLEVPAGTYHAFGVGQVPPAPAQALVAGGRFTLDGRAVSEAAKASVTAATTWYAEATGVVQFRSSDLFQLVMFTTPLPAASSTWGRVKRLYR